MTPTYSELDGAPKSVPDDIHHHDVTFVGPGDPWLVLRAGAAFEGLSVASRLGLSLPVGRTEEDPFALGKAGKRHEHMQFGTGTFVPIVGLGAAYAWQPVELSASALALFSVYANDEGFRAPSRFLASLKVTVPLAGGALRPHASGSLVHETEELWDGEIGLEGPSEKSEVQLGLGLGWRFSDAWEAELGVRARVARLTSASAFDYPGTLVLGISTHFDLGGPPDAR